MDPLPGHAPRDKSGQGWLGTANQQTAKTDSPYYLGSYFAPSYRYRRMRELLDTPDRWTVDDHWQTQRDVKNLMAEALAPIMAAALDASEDTATLGRQLAGWSFDDDARAAAPTVFQAVYRKFAELVFKDELGDKLTKDMLSNWYYWQQRLALMVEDGMSSWFDDVGTPQKVETRDELFRQAPRSAKKELHETLGGSPEEWRWGRVHRLELVNPLHRGGPGRSLLGGRFYGVGGSGETLRRGRYDVPRFADGAHAASLRMVIDPSDPDKVAAVLPGGVAGRTFHPHFNDQADSFVGGEQLYWWFSDAAIEEHAVHRLTLVAE